MSNLRQWELTKSSPYEHYLAADARLSLTDYTDDQIWRVVPGTGDSAAVAVQTRYGGRAGLASLIPMWLHEGRTIYQAQTYHDAPIITAFAPNYIALAGTLLPGVPVRFQHIALDSHSIGGVYTLHNTTSKPVTLRLDMFGHVGAGGKEQKLAIITLAGGGHALSMGMLKGISAVVALENGTASQISSASASPKIGTDFTLEPDAKISVRWVHVGEREIRASLSKVRRWLDADWDAFFTAIDNANAAIPTVQTSNLDWDTVIASAYNRVVQAFLRPAGNLPRETYVAGRLPEHGFSWKGDGSDHPRLWDGQDTALAYLLLPVLASIYPQAAEGALRNFIALQKRDGYIDLKPGAAGQRAEFAATPILARTAWQIYLYTENTTFLKDIYPALKNFFTYWLAQDADNDGVPEWTDDRQTHYVAFPTFGPGMVWTQGANIATVEAPDLLAYLLSEAAHLQKIADVLDEDANDITDQRETLREALVEMWEGDHYAYRDRDTHITTGGDILLENGVGDEEHALERDLLVPNRLIVTVVGGVNHIPRMALIVEGKDENGSAITETVDRTAFRWQNRQGIYTTQTTFSRVNRIMCDGLSRVYRIYVRTLDTTLLDINGLLPLIAADDIPETHLKTLAALALDKKRFLRPNGITLTDVQGGHFDPTSADGAGGTWFYFQTLLGEALLATGSGAKVTDMMKNTLNLLSDVLSDDHEASQFYHSDKPAGLGENGHLAGIAPLHLLMQLFGVRILSHEKVHISQAFAWGRGVTIRQHGVYVRRTSKRIKVEFPSGHVVELPPDAETQTLTDPEPVTPPELTPIQLPERVSRVVKAEPSPVDPAPEPPPAPSRPAPERVIIEVEHED